MSNLSLTFPEFVTAALVSAVLGCPASAAIVTFNTAGDLGRFQQNFPVGASASMTEVTSGGLNNSRAVDIGATDTTAIFKEEIYNFSAAAPTQTFNISSYFLLSAHAGTAPSFSLIQLGFGSDVGTFFNGNNDAISDFLSVRLRGDSSTSYRLQFQTATNGSAVNGPDSPIVTLTPGGYYFLSTTFTRTGTANTFTGLASLSNATSTGTVGTEVLTVSGPALTATELYTDPAVYAGFRANAQPGADLIDNFAAVPEPSLSGLLTLVALGATAHRRRPRH